MRKSDFRLAGFLSVFLLSACGVGDIFSDEAPPLKGDRISVLELQKTLEPDDAILEEAGLVMPQAWENEFWPQAGGYPNHAMQNLVLNAGELERVWRADIGQGATGELPLTAQPILVDGRVFTLDTDGRLSAFSAEDGERVWRVDVSDPDEDDPVIAGGIAFSDNLLFVTNGFSEVLTVSPKNGEIVWRKKIPAPSRAAPTILNGRVFVSTLDSRVLAMDVNDGRVLWEYNGIGEDAGLVGAASPAANSDIALAVFSSGEVTAMRVENGSVAWSDSLAAIRSLGGGLSTISDIRAMPVLDKGLVIVVSFSGRLVAIDERTGQRVWQREVSGVEMPWVAGNHLFVLSVENQLVALGRDTGVIRWITELPRFDDGEPVVLHGPVLAGGRLIVAGSDGRVIEIEPDHGQVLRQWDAGSTVASAPIVAGGTLYMLFKDGTLAAYR